MRRRGGGGSSLAIAVLIGGGFGLAARDNAFAHLHLPSSAASAQAHAAHLAHLAQEHKGTGQGPAAASLTAAGASGAAATAIAFVRSKLGDPYGYGATGPDSYDCSSLMQAAWAQAGVSIPRTSEDQWAQLPHVSTPQPGDLIFYVGSPIDPPPGHVTMFIGNGQMGEAYATGYPIRITGIRPGIVGYAHPG